MNELTQQGTSYINAAQGPREQVTIKKGNPQFQTYSTYELMSKKKTFLKVWE